MSNIRQEFRRALEEGYTTLRDLNPQGTPENRAAFLSEYIFDFTTYDDEKSEEFGNQALNVCQAINERRTFEYIKDPENYHWFLVMINTPFFARRINWGTSVRGAWWDISPPNETKLETSALWLDGAQLTAPLVFSREQWQDFIEAMLEFARTTPTTAPPPAAPSRDSTS